ncbi:MAG: hypothetical protein JXP34_22325 [Planctomycetes bacterium]|nr:hypothetical protein [Planctomycetota bacterium]
MVNDLVFQGFLSKQFEEGFALMRDSEILDLVPVHGDPPDTYLAIFSCRGLVRGAGGEPEVADRFVVGIRFPEGYLRRVDPRDIVTLVHPPAIAFHPNILGPMICIGHIGPGTPLVDILHQLHSILSYAKFSLVDFLNPAAAEWARHHLDRLPIDPRPLRRTRRDIRVKVISKEAAS